MSDAPLFPELELERARLAYSRACRDAMIAMFERVDPNDSADEFTKEYIEVTVEEALEDLRTPGAGDFFGRIDTDTGHTDTKDTWYIGRRHIEDGKHDPVVIDWRAPIAAPFYRATVHDPLGLTHRRRFMMTAEPGMANQLTSYLDEQLDDPESADAASGIPDPVLAEIGAARTGAMREIVATIQAEQDVVIRAPMQQALIVQGGPGTGKTAVGLHRAAYLLFEHRRRLVSEGVLVVGPNQVFLDYIGNVLPSLGERSVQQRTVLDLCVPRVEVAASDAGGADPIDVARLKGDPRLLEVLQRAVLNGIKLPKEPIRVPLGARTWVVDPDEFATWIDTALGGTAVNRPLNRRRDALKTIAQQQLQRQSDTDEAWSRATSLREALSAAWPTQQPKTVLQRLLTNEAALAAASDGLLSAAEQALLLGNGAKPGSKKRPWTAADQLLLDETNSLLNGPPFRFGHVVVDEAQDHSAIGLRVIGRRSPGGSFTILGDLAQSTTPAGQQEWPVVAQYLGTTEYEVAHLTIGYRVPEPVLSVANLLLPFTAVDTVASRSVRMDGDDPTMRVVSTAALLGAVAEEVQTARHRHVLTGVVAPQRLHDDIAVALAAAGLEAVTRVQDVQRMQIPIFSPEAVKGLEFDAVVVVNPAEIFDGTPRGARLLYVSMTRAVQVLRMVGDAAFDANSL